MLDRSSSGLHLDPRTKLFFLLLGNLTLFFHISTSAEILLMCLLFALFFLSGKCKAGLRLGALYAVLVSAELWLLPVADGIVLNLLSLLTVGIRMLLPCIVAGAYAFTTTTVGEFVCALRRMHVPEAVVIPCVVVIRFFPTISEDYRQIRSAMALRGVLSGSWDLLLHPMASLEYILIPLLVNSTNVAEDLTAAALTKGISLPGKHTSVVELSMTAFDWLYMLAATLPFILFWGGVL